ncbi:hypothetical protein UA45_20730 [Morganella morganii]|uniref:NADH:quinone oxidoreductase/Mrp antiporter transmembrane domain-containing protein n=1 Tax=Morganella morganii TaxID=582 RepID=A0A0D8L2T2_MORMO|nr:hypothetical protein UA45_20730 [Morganella morganii]
MCRKSSAGSRGDGCYHAGVWFYDVSAAERYETSAGLVNHHSAGVYLPRVSLSIFGSKEAFDGGIAYIFNHAFAKSLFFLVAGALSYSCGTRMLPRLRGLSKRYPLLGVGFCVAALAIAGVPPLNGFFSKFPIFAAGFALSEQFRIFAPIMVLVLIESVASFAWLLYWFGKVVPGEPSEDVANGTPVPAAMQWVIGLLIVMSFCSSVIAVIWLG